MASQRGGAARAQAGGAEQQRLRRLRHVGEDLAVLDRACTMLAEAQELSAAQPRAAFELSHRAALRAAGVLVARANRERRRALPLNVWTALARIGGPAAERAEEMGVLVEERERLDRAVDAQPRPALLARHLSSTASHLAAVRAEILADLPGAASAAVAS